MFHENLRYLRKKRKLSQGNLAQDLGIPRTTLGDYERGKTEPNIEMLIKIADYYKVDLNKLIRSNLSHEDLVTIQNKDFKVLAITVDKENKENVELVRTKAEAGYLESFADPEYISDLPKLSFPGIPSGTFRAFEIQGDSMLPLESGTVIICQYVEKLKEIKSDKTYIIVSKNEGLVYKRVRLDNKAKKLVLISDNDAYLPYEISFSDIDEVWAHFAHLSYSDSKTTFNVMLEEKLTDIHRKVTALHDR
jgi:transcriptional regulator with XRE-family HTH domain